MDTEKIAPILEEILKKTLEQKRYPFGFAKFQGMGNKVASGKLRDSISVVTKKSDGETIIQVLSEEYAQWVQSGRLPGKKGIPISAIEKWIKDRGLQGRDKRGRFIKKRSFAFAIQNNIKKFGIRPSNFLDVAIGDEAYDDLINLIEGI